MAAASVAWCLHWQRRRLPRATEPPPDSATRSPTPAPQSATCRWRVWQNEPAHTRVPPDRGIHTTAAVAVCRTAAATVAFFFGVGTVSGLSSPESRAALPAATHERERCTHFGRDHNRPVAPQATAAELKTELKSFAGLFNFLCWNP